MNKIIHGPNVAGQSLADRVMAAKHTITGQDLAKAVFKATTDEVMGPKRKHLDRKTTPILHVFKYLVTFYPFLLEKKSGFISDLCDHDYSCKSQLNFFAGITLIWDWSRLEAREG